VGEAGEELVLGGAGPLRFRAGEALAIAASAGLQVSFVPEWYDIDSVEDLRRAVAGSDTGAHRALRTEEIVSTLDAARRG
jgi:hypothetical protein